jgi:hypothetical protein
MPSASMSAAQMSQYGGAAMQGAGTITSVLGQLQSGDAAAAAGASEQQASNYRAAVLRQQATATRGQSSAEASDTALRTQYVLSSARARAGASGAGATDPSVVNTEGLIAGRGEYNVLSQLFSGEEKARGLENQASLDVFTGQQQRIAGQVSQSSYNTRAISTALQGGSSLFAKYGNGGFAPPPPSGGGGLPAAMAYGGMGPG